MVPVDNLQDHKGSFQYDLKQIPPLNSRKRGSPSRALLVIGTVCIVWLVFNRLISFLQLESEPNYNNLYPSLDFDDITPSEKLEWHPCRQVFMCARLTVPMDYHRPLNASSANPKVHLALLMSPGKHNSSKFSTSPLLINPGGPGGSGTMIAQILGNSIQNIVGSDQDVIGFDPRGVGATTPRADCYSYPSDGTSMQNSSDYEDEDFVKGFYYRREWAFAGRAIGLVNSSSDAISKLDVRDRTVAKLCQKKDSLSGKDSIFRYAHTPSVARDMLSIIDAWDEWITSISLNTMEDLEIDIDETYQIADSNYTLDTKGKLVFWGFSYGTLLGATFAAMFPDRVGRIVLDGVVDADNYVAPVWSESIRDADIIFESFPKYCLEGKEACALYREGDKLSDLEERFYGILRNLKVNPLTIINSWNSAVIITYDDLKPIIFGILYAPTEAFALLAILLNNIYLEDYELLGLLFDVGPPGLFCGPAAPVWLYPTDAQATVMCSDKRYPLNETIPNLENMFEAMSNLSIFSDVWLTVMMGCDGWKIDAIDPPMRWGDHPAHKSKPINTSFPLLFLSNTADPVTPLYAGVKMARKFVDAGLLEQNSMGHCSLAAASRCTATKVRKYFQEGVVPPHPIVGDSKSDRPDGKWDKCEADEWPFHPWKAAELDANSAGSDEEQIHMNSLLAIKQIQRAFADFKFFGMASNLDIGKLREY